MQRPLVTIQHVGGVSEGDVNVELPAVFLSPIRSDLVNTIYFSMARNSRQPYAVSPHAGEQTSAKSWGTGRAVSRIPRVSGSGTNRSGQGAFGNMCRGGRMFAPTKIWRRWHRRINRKQRRYAVCSALAASAVPSLVQARGHRISEVKEIPLVVSKSSFADIVKTKRAVSLLKAIHAYEDVQKVIDSKTFRAGKGRRRNRRYVQRRGPLLVYDDEKVFKPFRNIPGINIVNVHYLNILQLAPGGHVGRFIIWTEGAFKALDQIFGKPGQPSQFKSGFILPRPKMTHTDISRIVYSPEVQTVLRPKVRPAPAPKRVNLWKNTSALEKVNPYMAMLRNRRKLRREQFLKKLRDEKLGPEIIKKRKDNKRIQRRKAIERRKAMMDYISLFKPQ
ncbi:uncharacterized protein LOC126329066 [Schistocerca gregaria]|uniref:uncharacterized protein LOC126329066 n=1 Tax=Schistocerca gregaria TaxID=7010 RepID=UPI00211DBE05|nr:uncharacterized protein LOC126329066 [Schistocerca gregaria]